MRDIRLIRDQRSGKSKGVGYVEFGDAESVMKALALNGIAFKGQPLLVQASMAEKNRLAQAAKNAQAANEMMGMGAAAEPTKLMVSELHPHIAEADVREVFAPFGELAEVALMKDPATQASLGVANITYIDPAHAKDAQQAINGLELAGKQLVVQLVQDAPPVAAPMMGGGMGLAPLGGMGGMAGMMGMGGMAGMMGMDAGPVAAPSLCVLMKNMFDPNGEDEKGDPEFFNDLQEDVKEECGKYGAVVSAKVKPTTAGTAACSDSSSWQRQSRPAAHGPRRPRALRTAALPCGLRSRALAAWAPQRSRGAPAPRAKCDTLGEMAWRAAALAAAHRSRGPPACSGLLAGPERRALAVWMPKRGCGGAPMPTQRRRFHRLSNALQASST